MTKLAKEQIESIEKSITKYNEEAKTLSEEYKKFKKEAFLL